MASPLELRPESVCCSATLMCGELCAGEEDGGRTESATSIEELEADSALGESPGDDALAPGSVGLIQASLDDMPPTDELGCDSDGRAMMPCRWSRNGCGCLSNTKLRSRRRNHMTIDNSYSARHSNHAFRFTYNCPLQIKFETRVLSIPLSISILVVSFQTTR